jgi:hypothetical protein
MRLAPFAAMLKGTPEEMAGLDLTKIGAFPGAFTFAGPYVGSFSTASASAKAEVCVYVPIVSPMSLCRMMAFAMTG